LFLQTSPEFAMKRLLASGASAVFQVTRAFRRGEIGSRHNPEFSIVEWYRAGSTYLEQMDLTQDFVIEFFKYAASAGRKPGEHSAERPPAGRLLQAPFERMTYDAAFERFLGRPVIGLGADQLREMTRACGIEPPPSLRADDVDGWLNLLLALVIEPELAKLPAVFLYDYPSGQSALARVRGEVAERFELYLSGIEICNGYQELTGPNELRRRIAVQSAIRHGEGRRPLPRESRLLDAMESGLPPCAGVAIGFDRLMMAAVGAKSIADVMAFPFDRA
jgi:lysyl-tRNA synthetase class 2